MRTEVMPIQQSCSGLPYEVQSSYFRNKHSGPLLRPSGSPLYPHIRQIDRDPEVTVFLKLLIFPAVSIEFVSKIDASYELTFVNDINYELSFIIEGVSTAEWSFNMVFGWCTIIFLEVAMHLEVKQIQIGLLTSFNGSATQLDIIDNVTGWPLLASTWKM